MATSKMQRRKPGEHPVSYGTDKQSLNLVVLGVNRISMSHSSTQRYRLTRRLSLSLLAPSLHDLVAATPRSHDSVTGKRLIPLIIRKNRVVHNVLTWGR